MELKLNKDIGPYTIRAVPKKLVYMDPADKNETIELIKNFDTDKGITCITLAYWIKNSEGYELRFVFDRPFMIEDEYVLEIWSALKLAQLTLDEFWRDDDCNDNENLEKTPGIYIKSDEELIGDLNEYK